MLFLTVHTPPGMKVLKPLARQGRAIAAVLAILTAGVAPAQTVTLDFPREAGQLPVGLADSPRESFQGLATIEIPLLPLEEEGSILVSVIFQDEVERIIQAKWIAGGVQAILVSNLSEGVRAWNRRTFRIPSALLQRQGSLVLETDADSHPVRRVKLQWMWPGGVYLAGSAHAVEYVADAKTVLTAKEFSDSKTAPVPDSLADGIWKASLQDALEPLEEGVQFEVPVRVPRAAIFRAKLLGYPVSAAPVISTNDHPLAGVSVEIPDLGSPGYFQAETGEMGFAGWREVAVVIPAGLLQAGVNTITLEARKGAYIKDAQLELSFDEEGAPLDLFERVPPVAEEKPLAQSPFANILSGLDAPLDHHAGTQKPILFP